MRHVVIHSTQRRRRRRREEGGGSYGTLVDSFRYISLSADNTNTVCLYIYKSGTFLSRRSRHGQVVMTYTGIQEGRGRGHGEAVDQHLTTRGTPHPDWRGVLIINHLKGILQALKTVPAKFWLFDSIKHFWSGCGLAVKFVCTNQMAEIFYLFKPHPYFYTNLSSNCALSYILATWGK